MNLTFSQPPIEDAVGTRNKRRSFLFPIVMGFVLLLAACATPWQNESADLDNQDSQTALAIKAALIEAPGLAGSAIDASFANGRVTLTGFVETQEQRDRAVDLAREQTGVEAVVDEIVVK